MSCPECSTETMTIIHTHFQVHHLQARIAELEEALRPFAQLQAGPSRCTTYKVSKLGICKDLGVSPICDTCRAREVLDHE